jgi:hypothetical protein
VSTWKKRIKTKVLIYSFLFASIPNSVMAYAGFYPIEKGEVLKAEVCVPKNTKPPLSLQINGGNGKPVGVATVNSIPKSSGGCNKNESKVFINWKVDRIGIYSLAFYSTKSKSTFYGWPDGIEVSNPAKKTTTQVTPAERIITLPKLVGYSMAQVDEWKLQNNLKINLIYNTAIGYNHTISCQVQKRGFVLGQSYPAGTQLKDNISTSVFLDINC